MACLWQQLGSVQHLKEWSASLKRAIMSQAAGVYHAAARAIDVVILCVLWRMTGNLAAPLVAALLTESSDIAAVYRQTQHGITKLR